MAGCFPDFKHLQESFVLQTCNFKLLGSFWVSKNFQFSGCFEMFRKNSRANEKFEVPGRALFSIIRYPFNLQTFVSSKGHFSSCKSISRASKLKAAKLLDVRYSWHNNPKLISIHRRESAPASNLCRFACDSLPTMYDVHHNHPVCQTRHPRIKINKFTTACLRWKRGELAS